MENKKGVFIIFDYENDRHYRYLMQVWESHRRFNYIIHPYWDFSDNKNDVADMNSLTSRDIKLAAVLFVIVGKKTAISSWVKRVIDKAVELDKKIVAVKTDSKNETPDCLNVKGITWVLSFTEEAVAKALDNA